jgi:hypothetical protein
MALKPNKLSLRVLAPILTILIALGVSTTALAQSTATLQGTVLDSQGGAVPRAKVTVRNLDTGVERITETDDAGLFQVAALPVGNYRVEIRRDGFRALVASGIRLEVDTTVSKTFTLEVGELTQTVEVSAAAPLVEASTITVGQVINGNTVQKLPLNGRHFVDLALLAPGSMVPPQNGFLTAPLRGQGSFGVVTAGNREDTVNFMINGVNLNDMVQNQITFQPSINTVQEFKLSNSTFSAEYGHTSGTVVNIATRSGTNEFHGEAFEFLRNNALDAKNFFDNPTLPIPPFKRNQFGAALGGPIWKDHTFFFFSYEGLRQRQQVTFNRQVLDDAQRATVTDPTAQKLLPLIPKANVPGTIFSGSGGAPVNIDQWTLDMSHQLRTKDRIHGYYVFQRDLRMEPAAPVSASTLPGFGDIRQARRQVFTFGEAHTFSSTVVNDLRFGFNRIHITFNGANTDDPTKFGFTGLTAFGLPEIVIQDTGLDFGGVSGFPQGRGDTTFVWADTLSWLVGKHNFKFGTEIRRFYNNNFNNDMGLFTFPTVASFASGKPLQFLFVQGGTSSAIGTGAVQFFTQDNYKIASNFTLELGFRYERNTTPTERFNRFVAFNAAAASLRQVGSPGFDQIYGTNHDYMPRVGFAWDPFKKGKTSVRAGYGIFYDQPVTNSISGLSTNPPFTNNLRINSPPSFGNPFLGTPSTGGALNINSIDPGFLNSYVQDWNFNIEHEIAPNLGIMVGYFGAKGTHLRLSRNLNQPVARVLPFQTITLVDGTTRNANVITEIDSLGNSSYNALWVTASKRFSHGLQFAASYTFSKSLDYNSRNTQGIVIQDSTNPRGSRGPSDFDARHRFVISYLYELPFRSNRLVEGWAFSGSTSLQSGNPVTIVLGGTNPGVTNVVQTVRPNIVGNPSVSNEDPSGWFNPLAFAAPPSGQFGILGRNGLVVGPGFNNFDFSILKRTRLAERFNVEFRTEFFNIFNHPNFGQPGGVGSVALCTPAAAAFTVSSLPGQTLPAGTCLPNASFGTIRNASTGATINPTTFGRILTTRSAAGDAGSARQVQFALKFIF